MDDPQLLHMAINMNISLLTCEQEQARDLMLKTVKCSFHAKYQVEGILEASVLFRCIHKKTKLEYTCRLIREDQFEDYISKYVRAINIPFINRVVDILHQKPYVFVIFDSAYDDVHSFLKNKQKLSESEVGNIFKQIVKIVHNCHLNGILLTDIKLRKFVFTNPQRTQIKLESLDNSILTLNNFNENDEKTQVQYIRKHGCPIYMAPEIIELKTGDEYNAKLSDYWSLGIILYTLICGKYPFHNIDINIMFKFIEKNDYDNLSKTISPEICHLIDSLLKKNPFDRISTQNLLDSKWLSNYKIIEDFEPDTDQEIFSNEFKINTKSLHIPSQEYYSKLIKLVKLITISIEDNQKSKKNYNMESFKLIVPLPIVQYKFSSLLINSSINYNLFSKENYFQLFDSWINKNKLKKKITKSLEK